jgi:streptogramin lyase
MSSTGRAIRSGGLAMILALAVAAAAAAQPAVLRSIEQSVMPARPMSLAIDANGDIWLALQEPLNAIGRVNARACATDGDCAPQVFELPFPSTPQFITVDRRGKIWLTASNVADDVHLLMRFDPLSEDFDSWQIPARFGSMPRDIAVDSWGWVWFVDQELGVNSFSPGSQTFTAEYRTPEESRVGDELTPIAALGISIDPLRQVWCTCGKDLVRLAKLLVRPLIGRLQWVTFVDSWPIPTSEEPGSKPYGIFAERSDRVWLIDQHPATLLRFDLPDAGFTSWPIRLESDVKGLVDPHWLVKRGSTVFFTGFAGAMGIFDTRRETFQYILADGAPFDIAVDRAGRVWFTELGPTAEEGWLSRLVERRLSPPAPPIPPPVPPPIPDL